MQYKKVQKSSWNEPYSSSSFTKQSCSKMALYHYYYYYYYKTKTDSPRWPHFRRTRRWYTDASKPRRPRFCAPGRQLASSEAGREPALPSVRCVLYCRVETARPETVSQTDIRRTLAGSPRSCERSAEVASWSPATAFPAVLWSCSTDLCLDLAVK